VLFFVHWFILFTAKHSQEKLSYFASLAVFAVIELKF